MTSISISQYLRALAAGDRTHVAQQGVAINAKLLERARTPVASTSAPGAP